MALLTSGSVGLGHAAAPSAPQNSSLLWSSDFDDFDDFRDGDSGIRQISPPDTTAAIVTDPAGGPNKVGVFTVNRGSRAVFTGEATSPPTGDTAAERFGWGTPFTSAEFTSGIDGGWTANGPWPGHAGNGRRLPEQVNVRDGVVTITGLPNGDTGHMHKFPGSFQGRWEARVRLPAGCGCYHPVLILWPDAEDFPVGGEIDYLEVFDPGRQTATFFLHFGAQNNQISAQRQVDLTGWNHFAVEWTADHLTGYLNGEPWFNTTRADILPPRAMHPTIQLDWFPSGTTTTSTMEVDWIREYRL